jgi:uncharacterized coiled-coil protein SlyX
MIEIHIHRYGHLKKVLTHLLTSKFKTIMATLEDLQAKLAELQETVDAEQAQIADLVAGQTSTIAGLEAQIADLQSMLSIAPTPEQIQSVVDGLEAIKSDIAGTV